MRRTVDSLSRLRLTSSERPPAFLKFRSSKAFIQVAICFVVFTDIFMYGVLVPVLPFSLNQRVGIPPEEVQHWVSILLAVYGAALCVAAPITGWLADRSPSRRVPFLLGLFILAGATLMLCLGKNIGIILAGRILQGLSASVVWVVGLTVVSDTLGQDQAGQAMGYIGTAYSFGVLLAPLLGGVIYARAGYYAVYALAFAIIGVDIVFRLALIEKKQAMKWPQETDIPLEAISRSTDGVAQSDVPQASVKSEGSPSPVVTEVPNRKSKVPPIFLLLKSRRMLTAFWATFVAGVVYASFDTTLPLFVHRVFGWNSLGGGVIFLALSLPSFLCPLIGRYSDKHGPRWITALGFVMVLPFFVMLRLVTHNSLGQKVLLCALLILVGLAISLTIPPIMTEFTVIVEAKERQQPGIFGPAGAYAQAYAIFNVAWAAGYLVGPVWAGYVETTAGWGTMTWSIGAFSAVSALPVVFYTGGLITRRKTESRVDDLWE